MTIVKIIGQAIESGIAKSRVPGQEPSCDLAKPDSIGHSAAMGIESTSIVLRRNESWTHPRQPSRKFHDVAQLRKLRDCEQVAAVCFRIRGGAIEFLLVRTRGGRWIFPKGNAEPGLTHAQAAALEAFEEAGVHGRIEETCFIRFIRKKHGARNSSVKSVANQVAVHAHLCEVLRVEPPQERDRNPTWFSSEKAKRRLLEGRSPDYGAEITTVIDHAVARIQHSIGGRRPIRDTIQRVQFIDAR
ncbi:MAG: NUDIX domain-containing protein [Terriglobales bacterium]